jgi:methionine sulfoxide reductase heme-binding subunit
MASDLFWITSRAAGFAALVLASLAVSLGLVMSLKLLRKRGPDLLAFHEILSLSALVALVVHGVSLLGDTFVPMSLAAISVPFVSGFKTLWTSTGIIAGWMLIVLGVSYYFRRRIGTARWRKLHRWTALAWMLGVLHSLGEGTDAGQLWFLAMLAIVAIPATGLLLRRWLPTAGTDKPRSASPPRPARPRSAPPRPGSPRWSEPATMPTPAGPAGRLASAPLWRDP